MLSQNVCVCVCVCLCLCVCVRAGVCVCQRLGDVAHARKPMRGRVNVLAEILQNQCTSRQTDTHTRLFRMSAVPTSQGRQ